MSIIKSIIIKKKYNLSILIFFKLRLNKTVPMVIHGEYVLIKE
jgi:hypothetical protein